MRSSKTPKLSFNLTTTMSLQQCCQIQPQICALTSSPKKKEVGDKSKKKKDKKKQERKSRTTQLPTPTSKLY
jgi:hypothetical protein